MRRGFALVGLWMLVLVLTGMVAGCGSDEETESDDTSPPVSEATATTTAEDEGDGAAGGYGAITLPEGWAMQEAVSVEEVAAVTGEEMEYFPEAGSAAQNGRPSAGYLIPGTDGSKIGFWANVDGGEAEFERMKEFGEAGSVSEVEGVGDQAYVISFSETEEGIVALAGDAVVRVDWNPQVHDVDPAVFGTDLMQIVLGNMFQ